MIKPVKRNKRLKWIDSHYANFYKARVMWYRIQAAQIMAQSISNIKAIKSSTRLTKLFRAVAIFEKREDAINTLTKIPQPKGRVTK